MDAAGLRPDACLAKVVAATSHFVEQLEGAVAERATTSQDGGGRAGAPGGGGGGAGVHAGRPHGGAGGGVAGGGGQVVPAGARMVVGAADRCEAVWREQG